MTGKQYKVLERALEGFLLTLVVAGMAFVLLGVYALASWVF